MSDLNAESGSQGDTAHLHFTYRKPTGDLCQGDVLNKTAEVEALLRQVHPHYLEPDYTHFLILTQTCDLVRRNGADCKSRYITLAAVRPLQTVVSRAIAAYQSRLEQRAGVCSDEQRPRLVEFLRRLLNNNHHEYFYLHDDVAVGFHEPSCAFLQLCISVRAYQHYDTCLDARCVSLAEPFRAKLGWLAGNLFSRIGTEDWTPSVRNEAQFRAMIDEFLDSACLFVDAGKLRAASKQLVSAEGEASELRKMIEGIAVTSKRKVVADRVVALLQTESLIADEIAARRIRNLLISDPTIAQVLPEKRRS